jgi:hypothetical protein
VNAAVAEGTLPQAHGIFLCESFCAEFSIFQHTGAPHGEEGKEKESEEEEVISSLGVATLSATHEMGGWTYPAAFCLRDMRFEQRSRAV